MKELGVSETAGKPATKQWFYITGMLLLGYSASNYAEETSTGHSYSTLQGVTATATRTERDTFNVAESVKCC